MPSAASLTAGQDDKMPEVGIYNWARPNPLKMRASSESLIFTESWFIKLRLLLHTLQCPVEYLNFIKLGSDI